MTTAPDTTAARKREHILRLSQGTADTTIRRVSATKYQIAQRLHGQTWARFDLLASTAMGSPPPGGFTLIQLNQSAIDLPWLSIDHLDSSVTLSATGWSGNTAQALTYGGSYNQNNATVGAYVEWTAPVGAIRVGTRTVAVSNEGIALVTIDGDATRANLLPTAQTLVTAGKLASTALVANGGTLNPTDRVLDLYSAASAPTSLIDYDRHYALADGLAPGSAHVVRLTLTGYKNVQSSDIRLYVSGFTYAATSTTIDTATAELLPLVRTLSQYDSAYEYAHEFAPSGSTNYQFVGNVHGYENGTAFRVYIDGEETALTDGERRHGAITIVRTSELYHPTTPATKQADVTTTYRLGATGLVVEWAATWAVTGATVRRSYPAMFPVNGDAFTIGSLTYATSDYALTANAGTYYGKIPSDLIYMWEPAGTLGALLHVPDLDKTVANWGNNAHDIYAAIEDRVPTGVNLGNLSKAYITRQGSLGPLATVAAGDVWKSAAMFRLFRLPEINSALARV